MVALGAALRAAAERKGLSDGEVARRLGVSARRYSHYVNDTREPPLDLLKRTARILDTSVDALLDFEENGQAPGLAEAPSVFHMQKPDSPGARSRLSGPVPRTAFYFRAGFAICDRLGQGWHGLVEPAVELERGDLAYGEDHGGTVAVFRIIGDSDRVPDGMLVDPFVFGTGQESWSRSDFARLHPITWTGRTTPPLARIAPEDTGAEDRRRFASALGRVIAELEELEREVF